MLDKLFSFFEDSYLFIAVLGSTVFVIQFIMTVSGLSHDGGGADLDGNGIPDSLEAQDASDIGHLEADQAADVLHVNFFSLKSIVAFFTFYGWGGYCFRQYAWRSLPIAVVCGLVMMAIISLLIALMLRLQQSGNIRSEDFIGKSGTAYLRIAGHRQPGGRATILLGHCTREVSVVADEEIATGQTVVILESLGNNTYLVKQK